MVELGCELMKRESMVLLHMTCPSVNRNGVFLNPAKLGPLGDSITPSIVTAMAQKEL